VNRLTATEVARNFSSIANRVGAGEEIEVVRNGAPLMRLLPPSSPGMLSVARWRELLADLPAVDEDFGRDVEAARKSLGPPRGAWPS
jgi:antitoxin (DNA-binding transcriptional repressor) of toxin-antitoxin stability system